MEKRKLLIADGTEEFCLALEGLLREEFCIRCAGSGAVAKELLRSFRPEFIVLDVRLPGLDGLEFLQALARLDLCSGTLVTTATASPWVVGKVWELGVRHILQKPCALQAAANQVRQMAGLSLGRTRRADLRIVQLLLELGLNAKHDGFHYLRDAVLIYRRDPKQTLTKELYHTVGGIYGATSLQVERSIRGAIKIAWKTGNSQVHSQYFPEGRPTNGRAIAVLCEYIELESLQGVI